MDKLNYQIFCFQTLEQRKSKYAMVILKYRKSGSLKIIGEGMS